MENKVESKHSKPRNSILFVMAIAYCLLPIASKAQCAMCRAALESSENIKQAEAVNDGIVFLMIIPYLLVAIVGFGVYKIKYAKR